jgi:hypothetical protein
MAAGTALLQLQQKGHSSYRSQGDRRATAATDHRVTEGPQQIQITGGSRAIAVSDQRLAGWL